MGCLNEMALFLYLDQDIIQSSDVMAELAEQGTYVSIDETRVEEEREAEELEFGEEPIIEFEEGE